MVDRRIRAARFQAVKSQDTFDSWTSRRRTSTWSCSLHAASTRPRNPAPPAPFGKDRDVLYDAPDCYRPQHTLAARRLGATVGRGIAVGVAVTTKGVCFG